MASRRFAVIAVCATIVAIGAAASWVIPDVRNRAKLTALKLGGSLDGLSWGELARVMDPRGPYRLGPLVESRNAYLAILNPYTSAQDVAAGSKIFQARCASCHGSDGKGGAEADLTGNVFRHGASDWAMYRTITRGVPGTAMVAHDLPEREVWSTVAYVRSLRKDVVADARDALAPAPAVTEARLLGGVSAGEWLMYSGSYNGQRYSPLDQIQRDNVRQLRLDWMFQLPVNQRVVETTPLVAGGVMYLTGPHGEVWALDAGSGKRLWEFTRRLPGQLALCCVTSNRGLAIRDNTLFLGTLDAHLLALDARNGRLLWDSRVADHRAGYSITSAPLVVGDNVITGVGGGEFGIRGFVAAFERATGKLRWKFNTIPGPGEAGHDTWAGNSWETGGAPTWLTGSYDPALNLIYWAVGNPGPDYNGAVRAGDNLYSNSMLALDAASGALRWHFQFTPHDEHDWDANQIPVLVDDADSDRRLLITANRNGFYYVLDRANGAFLGARAFVQQNWAQRLDSVSGRPVVNPATSPSARGSLTYPGGVGATNWWSPSYSPQTGLFYVPAVESGEVFFRHENPEYREGEPFLGGDRQFTSPNPRQFVIRALDARTGELRWEYKRSPPSNAFRHAGLLSTAGGLLFGGDQTFFLALDARTGTELWRVNAGDAITAAPISYLQDGRQMIVIAAGRTVLAFSLAQKQP